MKEFVTAVKAAETEGNEDGQFPVTFKVDGREVTAYRPGDGQLAVLMVSASKHAPFMQQVAGAIDFLMSITREEDAYYLRDRLLDRHDPFGIEEVQDILMHLVEEWTGRPTEQPSGSSSSQEPGGQNSTLPTPASI